MLQNLHVKNLALIEEAEVDFEKGLNILTGETGAGKSIILGSVGLALGGRFSADILRKGTSYGLVELVFQVEGAMQQEALRQLGIEPEGGQVIFSRKLMEGRSVSRINGETVPNARLKEAAAILIDIHGQHEHQSLLYKKNHLQILDAFAKEELRKIKETYTDCYRIYKEKKEEWTRAGLNETERRKEADYLSYEIREIEEASLRPGEDEELEERYNRMHHGRKILENLQEAYSCTAGQGENAGELLGRALRCIQEAGRYDSHLSVLYEQFQELDNLLNDAGRELAEYMTAFEFSEEEYYETENRLNEINHIKSRYGDTVEKVLQDLEEKKKRLEVLENYDSYLAELKRDYMAAEKKLHARADELGRRRREAAARLTEEIQNGLLDLNFLDVRFEMAFGTLPEYTPGGIDDPEFMISLNPGEPLMRLTEVASGGELSRIMLAIKTVLAEKDAVETMIFDEIDVGISGRTAQKVSEKMAILGKKRQVICITHLAQIAAMADAHYLIEKQVKDGSTMTGIRLLDQDESVRELARILGGAEITETVLKSASEMKELAKRTK